MELKNMVGLDEVKEKLQKAGVKLSDMDMAIAEVMFQTTMDDSYLIRGYEDLDGIIERPLVGLIPNQQLKGLIALYPNAALLIRSFDHGINYGFYNEKGEVKRVGMMGDVDQILDAQEIISTYLGKGSLKFYKSKEDYSKSNFEKRMRDIESRPGYGTPIEQVQYNYNDYGSRRR